MENWLTFVIAAILKEKSFEQTTFASREVELACRVLEWLGRAKDLSTDDDDEDDYDGDDDDEFDIDDWMPTLAFIEIVQSRIKEAPYWSEPDSGHDSD